MSGLVNFEDEEEVKVYLENLGIEYSFQCYKEHDPDGKVVAALEIDDREDCSVIYISTGLYC